MSYIIWSIICILFIVAITFFFIPSKKQTLCNAGYYCPGNSIQPIKCPLNTTSVSNSTNKTSCSALPGYYGKVGEEATKCEPGSFCPGLICL